jgi:hypothetical protein
MAQPFEHLEAWTPGVRYQDVKVGLDVMCADNKRLGEVNAVVDATPTRPAYFEVARGIIYHKSLYIPLDAIDHVGVAVYLKGNRDECLRMGMEKPPAS